jgi:hypothetical protein
MHGAFHREIRRFAAIVLAAAGLGLGAAGAVNASERPSVLLPVSAAQPAVVPAIAAPPIILAQLDRSGVQRPQRPQYRPSRPSYQRPIARPPQERPPVARPPVARPPVARPPVTRPPHYRPPVVVRPPAARPPVIVVRPNYWRPWRPGIGHIVVASAITVAIASELRWCHFHRWRVSGMAFHSDVRCHRHADWDHPSIAYVRSR